MLGIPTVLDRLIQQMLLQVMTPIFEPRFSEHSYGFRPGRKAHDAVRAAQGYVRGGKDWVVDMDITKFFDHVNHDILMGKIGEVIRDKRVLRLIGKISAGGSDGGGGGGEERRRHAARRTALAAAGQHLPGRAGPGTGTARAPFSRYADDCNIYVGSQRAAERVLESVQEWIETHLRLEVNATKERGGEDLGTEVSGISTQPPRADRSGPGERGAIQSEGAGDVAELPESDQ